MTIRGLWKLACGLPLLLILESLALAAPPGAAAVGEAGAGAAPSPAEPRRPWEASVHGRWFPGVGEAKGSVGEGGGLDAGAGLGIRLSHRFGDWWSLGVGLSTATWGVGIGDEPGVLDSGSFLDAALLLKLEPLELRLPGGVLRPYALLSGGPTLTGETRFARTRPVDAFSAAPQLVRFEAGYNAGVSLGASYQPSRRWSVFAEAGLDWHYALHARRALDLEGVLAGSPPPPAIAEKLWFGQGVVALGAAYAF